MKTNRDILARVEAIGLPNTYGGHGVPCWLIGGYWYTADAVAGKATKQAEGFSRTDAPEWEIPLSEALGTLS